METAEECLVCGVIETQPDQVNNVALLPVLAALLGSQQMGAAPQSACALCRRCCHLLTEAATLQRRMLQVKEAILSVYRPVQYHRSTTAPLSTASAPLPVSTSSVVSAATEPTVGQFSTTERDSSVGQFCATERDSSAGQFSATERGRTITAAQAVMVPAETTDGAPGQAGRATSSASSAIMTGIVSVSSSTPAAAETVMSTVTSAVTSPVVTSAGSEAVTSAVTSAAVTRRLPCPVCGKSVTARYLRAHQRQHSGERPFACALCPRSFAKSSDLSTHRRRHAGDRRHRCPLCPAAFFFPHELVRHKHRHGESRPHLCPECGAGFFSRAGLQRHQRSDHPPPGVDSPLAGDSTLGGDATLGGDSQREKECAECGKKFACERSLRRHERAHGAGRRYMCEECGVTYRTSTALRFHTRRQHSGERPYQCEVCGRPFITRSVWLRHLRVHTGEAPFRCQFCAAAYKDKQKLKRHYSNKHAAEVARVGVENLRYTAGAGAGGETGQPAPPQSLPAPLETCDLDPGRAMPDLDPGQAQVGHVGWAQQWKAAAGAEQAYGAVSAAAAHQGNSSAIQSQQMAPVEMMQDSVVLPQGMLYEAQSALFSYF